MHIGLSTLTDKTLPFSSLSLSSLFLSLLDCSFHWLYKTTFFRIECIMFLHMGKLYFILTTHLSWIKAYSFTLATVPCLFKKTQYHVEWLTCCSFSCTWLRNFPWMLANLGNYRKCQSPGNTWRVLKNWTWARKNVWCISKIKRKPVLQSHSNQIVWKYLEDRHTDQWSRIESPEINRYIYDGVIFDKTSQWKKGSLFYKCFWETWYLHARE